MRRPWAVAGSAVFFVLAPGSVAGWLPWALSGWSTSQPAPAVPWRVLGALAIAAGLASLLESFARFALAGEGTPAPLAPPTRLVASGQYRHVRNPMYVAVLGLVVGQALLLGSRPLALYAAGLWLVLQAWVVWYEEPRLERRFGAAYRLYRAGVRRWLPRRSPWRAPR